MIVTVIIDTPISVSTKLPIKRQFTARLWEVNALRQYLVYDIIHTVPLYVMSGIIPFLGNRVLRWIWGLSIERRMFLGGKAALP